MPATPPLRSDITGLMLAGGAGRRMGGRDKGLLTVHGRPLAHWTLERLAPQVGELGISANRNQETYRQLGAPVWPDAGPGFDGPLAGIAAGLAQCKTPYLAVVPCDTPCFPSDLVERLAHGLAQADADLAMAAVPSADTGEPLAQPVFCLLRAALLPSLREFLADGGRKTGQWARGHHHTFVLFGQADAFAGANTPDELAALSLRLPVPQSENAAAPHLPSASRYAADIPEPGHKGEASLIENAPTTQDQTPGMPMQNLIGLAGWSGAGKTTLLERVIPVLTARGLRVSTLKHAHHNFDIDKPGKDSHRHRQAGATQVMVASGKRWALMQELREEREPELPELLGHMQAVDLLIVEGYKQHAHAKIEIYRQANGKPWIHPRDPLVKAIASDVPPPQGCPLPWAHLDDAQAVAELMLAWAEPWSSSA